MTSSLIQKRLLIYFYMLSVLLLGALQFQPGGGLAELQRVSVLIGKASGLNSTDSLAPEGL